MAAVRAGVGREAAHEVIKTHAVAVALDMRRGQATNDLFDRLAADGRLGLDRAALEALVAEPIEFTGAARDQVARVVAAHRGHRRPASRCRHLQPGSDPVSGASAGAPGSLPGRPEPTIPPAPAIPGYTPVYSGKVRDLYRAPDGALLFVASDRISAYDWVLPTTIPDKGAILTQLSLWWFERVADIVDNHVLDGTVPAEVAGRAMLCRPLEMFPVECVARGYLTGSGLVEYADLGVGVRRPAARRTRGRLPAA